MGILPGGWGLQHSQGTQVRGRNITNVDVRDKLWQKIEMADKAAERIRYKTEVLKLLVLLTVAIGGGSLGVVLGTFTPLRAGLATVGIVITLVLLVVTWRHHRQIEDLIDNISEES